MEKIIKNTKFDNLVNYQTHFFSNSSKQSVVVQSSADPNVLSALIKNNQIVNYSILTTQEKLIQQTDIKLSD